MNRNAYARNYIGRSISLALILAIATTSYAQSLQMPVARPDVVVRNYGGWTSSKKVASSSRQSTPAAVQHASHYQQMTDSLPSFGAMPGPPAQNYGDSSANALAASLSDLPAMPTNNFASRSAQVEPPSGPNQYDANVNSLRGENQVLPAQNEYAPNPNGRPNGLSASAPPPMNYGQPSNTSSNRNIQASPAAYQNSSGSVLPPPQAQAQNNPMDGGNRLRQSNVASGLPYVTPAPNQRYPTSPYMGPRMITAGYQRPVSTTLAAQQTPGIVLPQNQQPVFSPPAAAVYPTAYQQCAPSLPPDAATMGAYVPPTVTPNWNPTMYSPNNSGYRPLFSLGQENYNVVMGRGIVGQPTVYVPGQYVRNFLRYIFP